MAPGSIVTAEMTIRCKSLATQKDPGGEKLKKYCEVLTEAMKKMIHRTNFQCFIGVKYYDTKVDSPSRDLTWVFGSGEFSPAVEEALLGKFFPDSVFAIVLQCAPI